MKKLPQTNFKMKYVPLQGGDDMATPALSVDPGRAIFTSNYELDVQGRYRLINGYEVYDGKPKPHETVYHLLYFDAGSTEISVGEKVTGGTSTADGYVLEVNKTDGSWIGGDAEGYLILHSVDGTFVDDESLTVSAIGVATANGAATERGVEDDTEDNIYVLQAIESARDRIAAVPGEGDILGVWQYDGYVYAFRNAAGGLEAKMYQALSSGWEVCDLGRTIAFTSGGVFEPFAGLTITGATSGATATVKRVTLSSGTWAGGDAAGTLVIYSQSGTFEAENLNIGLVLNVATISGNSAAVSLEPDGRYEFVNTNFGGHAGTRKMYGCDGANPAFEWDGSVFLQISTGMTTDTPTHIAEHKHHLFLMFEGGSIQHSSLADPHEWSAVTGASEIATGDEGTAFLTMPTVMVIFCRNSTHVLYGSSTDDWQLEPHSMETGAIEWTPQRIGSGMFLDDRGITTLSATDRYGDFQASVISTAIDPYLRTVMGNVQCSVRVKDKNQYRLIFDNKEALTLTMNGDKVAGFTRQLYNDQIVCICSSENSDGREEIFFGCDDGFVYQMDVGTSFNGDPLPGIVKFHFNHLDSPRIKKRIRKIVLELEAPIHTYIGANVEFDYGDSWSPSEVFEMDHVGGVWGINSWDQFEWDGKTVASAPLNVDGTGMNFSFTVYHSGTWELQESPREFGIAGLDFPHVFTITRSGLTGAQPHTLQGYIVQYDIRGVQR